MTNLEMQNLIGMMLVITGLAVFVVLTQILDVIQWFVHIISLFCSMAIQETIIISLGSQSSDILPITESRIRNSVAVSMTYMIRWQVTDIPGEFEKSNSKRENGAW